MSILETLSPKLDSLARCILRIESKRPAHLAILESDIDLQDILSINLERAVQQCIDIGTVILSRTQFPIPNEMSEVFTALKALGWITEEVCERMKKAVGFRNLAVHEYEKVDWGIVYKIVTFHLDDFKKFASEVSMKASISEIR